MDQDHLKQVIEAGVSKYHRKLEGTVVSPPMGRTIATRDAIRHFADGLGDSNPLYRDPKYAEDSCHGGLIASPLFLNAISEGQAIVGLPGLIATFVGASWEWFALIREGDSFSVSNELLPLEDKTKEDGLRRFLQTGILRYTNQRQELVGICTWRTMRSQTKLAGRGTHSLGTVKVAHAIDEDDCKPHHYSESESAEIFRGIDAEEVRGPTPRRYQEVSLGDTLNLLVKGPLSLSDMVPWAMGLGWHRMCQAHGLKLRWLRDHPGLSYVDPSTGMPEPIAMSHFDAHAARILMGSPLPLDLGFQRVCWLGHVVTNWQGDTGFLKNLTVRLSGFVRFGDTVWCGGKVVGKKREAAENLVELELYGRNQRGGTVASGHALVALPN
jgi:acyl dehydratase